MSVPQQGAQAQTAAQSRTLGGTLAKTPVPRLLMSASNALVSGTLELQVPDGGETATVVFVHGMVTKVQTSARGLSLGAVLYELGYIDTEMLNDSLRELARMQWLHGEILLTRGAISAVQLAEGLAEQTTRKLAHLFSLPRETTYAFEADVDKLKGWGGEDWPHVDPAAAVWRGVRDGQAQADIEAAFEKLHRNSFRLALGADPKRFDMSDVDVAAVCCLRARPLTLDELTDIASIEPMRARELVYFLMVTKQAEVLETSGVRPAFRPPADALSNPHTKPTIPEMPAAGSAPKISVAPVVTESARWRAVAPVHRVSMEIPRMEAAESARIPASAVPASRRSSSSWVMARPERLSSAPPTAGASSSPRITIGGVAPATEERRSLTPPPRATSAMRAAPALDAPPASGRATLVSSSPTSHKSSSASMPSSTAYSSIPGPGRAETSTPAPAAPFAVPVRSVTPQPAASPSGSFKVSAADAARRQSIFERARAILKEDHFQRMSLPRDASSDQVEAAFAALKTLWDPAQLNPALEEAKNDCAFVLSCLAEAHSVLRDDAKRGEYLRSLSVVTLRSNKAQVEEDLAASGAADLSDGAYVCFRQGDMERAERLARSATKATPDAGAPLALLAWIEATRPNNTSHDETRKRIVMLDKALRLDPMLEQAHYWRGLLHKRLDNHSLAMGNFRRVIELNPKHIDAQRELRVYEMRIRRNSISMKSVKS